MSNLNKRTKTPTGRHASSWLHIRLDTLLLLVTLATVGAAYFKARATRLDWQLQLNRLEKAKGIPFITDITQAEVVGLMAPFNNHYPIKQVWYVWIPIGQSAQIRLATSGFAQEFPDRYESFTLVPGRHCLSVYQLSANASLKVLLEGKAIWERAPDGHWNIASPCEYSLSSKGSKFPKAPEVIFSARGNLRLKADEEFKPEMLDFGLKMWLVK